MMKGGKARDKLDGYIYKRSNCLVIKEQKKDKKKHRLTKEKRGNLQDTIHLYLTYPFKILNLKR